MAEYRHGFGSRVRVYREQSGMTRRAYARSLGVNSETTRQWERGVIPTPETLMRLADLFGTTPDALLAAAPEEENPPAPDIQGIVDTWTARLSGRAAEARPPKTR